MTTSALLAADLTVGFSVLLLGLLQVRRDDVRSGLLLGTAGLLWLLGSVLPAATFWHRGVLLLVVLRVLVPGRSWRSQAALSTACGAVGVLPLASSDGGSLLLSAIVSSLAVVRWPLLPRAGRPLGFGAAALLAAAFATGPVARLSGVDEPGVVLLTYDGLVFLVAVVLTIRAVRRTAGTALTGLVIDLGEAASVEGLQDRLARGLGDPSVVVGFWVPSQDRHVDEAGAPVELPDATSERTATALITDGQPVGVLVHDSSVSTDPRLLGRVAAAASWAVANVRLRADVRDRVDRVEASRRRLLETADDERRSLSVALHTGPERRLARVAEIVHAPDSALGGLATAVEHARADLRELGRGLHPRLLTAGGLAAGLRQLADVCPVDVRLTVPPGRLPAPLESAVYFACAEALTNVAKYARATSVDVDVQLLPDAVHVVVQDDGAGGAEAARGGGLRGLSDRAEALSGGLTLLSPPGRGTRLELRLPLRRPGPLVEDRR